MNEQFIDNFKELISNFILKFEKKDIYDGSGSYEKTIIVPTFKDESFCNMDLSEILSKSIDIKVSVELY